MQIVILDSDPAFGSLIQRDRAPIGGMDCPELVALGKVTSYQNTPPERIVERCKGARVVLSNKVPLGQREFAALPELELVSVLATGFNVIDLEAARSHGVTVCNVPGYSTAATAQHAIALLLELENGVGSHSAHTLGGGWEKAQAFSYFLHPTHELEDKTLGIVGLGAIGTRVGKIAEALGMRVLATTRTQRADAPFPLVELDELLAQSEVVTLHCPLTSETKHLFNAPTLAKMRPGALLINVARGPIVDEAALAEALRTGHLRGAATDVLEDEPPRSGSPLLSAPNCIVTPHIAWASVEARRRLLQITAKNIDSFLRGAPQNVVS